MYYILGNKMLKKKGKSFVMYKVKICVNEKKKKERHIQTDILISYVV